MKLAVLLGAGASFGAGPTSPTTPPLGKDLYQSLRDAFPGTWGSMIHADEAAAFTGDPPFEEGMRRIWNAGDGRAQPLLIDMAKYFSRFAPRMGNLYANLLAILFSTQGLRPAFASLNYETIFEQVLTSFGLRYRSLEQCIGSGRHVVSLVKPHGSCNYISPLTDTMSESTMGGSAPHYLWIETVDGTAPARGHLEVRDAKTIEPLYERVGLSMPPAMCMYEPTKHAPVASTVIAGVQAQWAANAAAADCFLCIGARPVLTDNHIWDPILESSSPVWFVGGRDELQQECAVRIGGRMAHVADTLAEGLPKLRELLPRRG